MSRYLHILLLLSTSFCFHQFQPVESVAQLEAKEEAESKSKQEGSRSSAKLSELIEIQQGDLPLIISAPHGGSLQIEGSTDRKGLGVNKFVVVRDTYTDRLARAVADSIISKTGRKPFVVIAHFARRHADANRPADGAYENDSAKRVYDAYHSALTDAHKRIIEDHGRGLIIDIHGQGAEQKTIFRGTQNRSTVKTMLEKYGEEGFSGPRSVLGFLVERGYVIKPSPQLQVPEDSRYNGGFITQSYGSKNGGSMDAIQLEFGSIPRSLDQYQQTANDLADALIAYSQKYLGQQLTTKPTSELIRKSK